MYSGHESFIVYTRNETALGGIKSKSLSLELELISRRAAIACRAKVDDLKVFDVEQNQKRR